MIESSDPNGYTACCAALREFDARQQLSSIAVPTLVIAGSHDLSTPSADGRFIADQVPGAGFFELPAAHLSNIESAAQFSAAVLDFLL
jgi:pimeloyl-ACP methyl ester carboxylesterase